MLTKRSLQERRKLRKLVAAVGGFIVLIGVMLLGIAIQASVGFINVGLVLEIKFARTFAVVTVVVGVVDTFAVPHRSLVKAK